MGFSNINHPAIGVPPFIETPISRFEKFPNVNRPQDENEPAPLQSDSLNPPGHNLRELIPSSLHDQWLIIMMVNNDG